ncbi:aldo/keto reductase [Micromonospora sp. C95]|uniref:aldo/keto reductase n=1 Tax=Micromonospora sp. C95 TaxID=2824882 RepID=UPI001B38D58D|nr:aldo/keto reductase [Micromonospora sp. C95]MBQ1026060.1 aldo/keto reductase [Micromonospora sp. C95]
MAERERGGRNIPAVGLGTSPFGKECDERTAEAVVRAALDFGIAHFDTADSYGPGRSGRAEQILGRALHGVRDRVFITSKVGTEFAGQPPSLSPDRIRAGIEASLRRLRTDYLDAYLLHVPDPATALDDAVDTLAELVDAGLVRAIGAANHHAEALLRAAGRSSAFTVVQDEYSLLRRDVEMETLPACRRAELDFVCYAPLAEGLLTGKYERAEPALGRLSARPARKNARWQTPQTRRALARFLDLCAEAALPPAQVALRWLLDQRDVTAVIPAATTVDQVAELASAVTVEIDRGLLAAVTDIDPMR